jgi:hypothetical protein
MKSAIGESPSRDVPAATRHQIPHDARARVLLLAVSALLATAVAAAQTQVPVQEQTRREFSEYLRLEKKNLPAAPPLPVGPRRAAAAAAVRGAPGKDAMRQRMLKAQQQRVPHPDVRNFLADNPVIEEVSAGADPDFAQVVFWNEAALRITSLDHTAPPPGSSLNTHPFEQVGPVRTSRAMAIVHVAMFEAVNAVARKYESYKGIQKKIFDATGLPPNIPADQVSVRHAIAYSAYQSLRALYPGKADDLDATLAANLAAIQVPANQATNGKVIGEAAARAILDERAVDGSELPDPPSSIYQSTVSPPDPLKWRQDPLNPTPAVALGSNWRHVRPFVLTKPDQFRPDPPPAVGTPEYNDAFKMVLEKGGDPNAGQTNPPGNADRRPTPTTRTDDETFIGKFWAYDGTALLCAPPRLYNMVATSLALNEEKGAFPDALSLARYLALINVAMVDAGIASWEAKFYYLYPRPVTAIRAATPATAPITAAVPFWTPLGAPVSNGPPGSLNFSPPFPAYTSGHATFGGALFQVFRRYYMDNSGPSFTFVSDEYNGLNSDPGSPTPRPLKPMTFTGFAHAEHDNAYSRLYLGIHWKFDADQGIALGNKVGDYVFDHLYKEVAP